MQHVALEPRASVNLVEVDAVLNGSPGGRQHNEAVVAVDA
jgi:hypothetical protein